MLYSFYIVEKPNTIEGVVNLRVLLQLEVREWRTLLPPQIFTTAHCTLINAAATDYEMFMAKGIESSPSAHRGVMIH